MVFLTIINGGNGTLRLTERFRRNEGVSTTLRSVVTDTD